MTSLPRCLKLSFLMIFFVSSIFIWAPAEHTEAFSPQVIQQGSTGDDVTELQARLQYIGFYNGQIDSVFGWQTYWALRNFQYEFGLKVDGLAGQKTKQKLVDATKYDKQWVKEQLRHNRDFTYYGGTPNWKETEQPKNNQGGNNQQGQANQQNQQGQQQGGQKQDKPGGGAENIPDGYSQNDINLMANAVHGESRGEPYIGKVAVAAVIINRTQSSSFPDTVSGVIFEPRAFTAVSDGQIWLSPDKEAKKAVLDALNGWDPTGEAIYYFNPNTATSGWIWSRPQIKKIGKHIFAK
jgi:N-acetylmuramoyl-L-alanine amidase